MYNIIIIPKIIKIKKNPIIPTSRKIFKEENAAWNLYCKQQKNQSNYHNQSNFKKLKMIINVNNTLHLNIMYSDKQPISLNKTLTVDSRK